MHRHFLALCSIPVIIAIICTHQGIRGALALNNDDIPEQCRSRCDASVSMLNSCGLDTAGRNADQDNSACFCQNVDKANYHDCASCVREYQGDDAQADNNSYNEQDDGNENGQNDDNSDGNDDEGIDNDASENGSRKRAVFFGQAAATGLSRRGLVSKRGLLADLLNLDGLVCTANGVVSDALSVVGVVQTEAGSLVTRLVGPTPTPSSSRDDDRDTTITSYITITTSGSAISASIISHAFLVAAALLCVTAV